MRTNSASPLPHEFPTISPARPPRGRSVHLAGRARRRRAVAPLAVGSSSSSAPLAAVNMCRRRWRRSRSRSRPWSVAAPLQLPAGLTASTRITPAPPDPSAAWAPARLAASDHSSARIPAWPCVRRPRVLAASSPPPMTPPSSGTTLVRLTAPIEPSRASSRVNTVWFNRLQHGRRQPHADAHARHPSAHRPPRCRACRRARTPSPHRSARR